MKNSITFIAFITALSLHLIIGAVILLGMDFSSLNEKPKQEVAIINASIVNQKLFDDLAQKKANNLAAAKRKEQQIRKEKTRIKREEKLAKKRRDEAKTKRIQAEKAEVARKKKLEDRLLFEKIVAAKELRAKKVAQKAKKLADAKRIKAEKIASAKALKKRQAKEAKLKAQKVAAERLRQAELDKQMEAEFADAFSSAQSSKQLSEIARYKALIQDKISRNWQIEASMKGKSCTLAIRLAPDGLVLSAKRSKGDQKLCDSARRATLKSKTLPIPKDPEIAPQFRDFDITLEPDL